VASHHILTTSSPSLRLSPACLGRARHPTARLAHLPAMDTNNLRGEALEPVLSMSQLAARLPVSVQTIYDLRSQGRGLHGIRVGRELRFRVSEVEAWLSRLETADADRHAVTHGRL
jgi:excisionase family DNA binding protein